MDVRNVADAHAHALKLPQGTSERFLLSGGVDYFEDGVDGLRARGKKGLGEVGARCFRSKHFAIDRSKPERMLELSFIPFEKTVEDIEKVGLHGVKAVRHLEHQMRHTHDDLSRGAVCH